MKPVSLAFLGLFSFGLAAGCGTSQCSVDCAPGYTPDPSACTCLPLDAGVGGGSGAGGVSGQGGGSGAGGASGASGAGGAGA